MEQQTLSKVLLEWKYLGVNRDHTVCVADCELCGQLGLRFDFQIENSLTKKALWVGSKCIERFTAEGFILDPSMSMIAEDLKQARKSADRKSVTRLFDTLKSHGEDIDSLKNYFDAQGRFTPKQLSYLLWRCDVHKLDYSNVPFKLNLRREKYQIDLKQLPDWRFAKIKPFLTTAQLKTLNL